MQPNNNNNKNSTDEVLNAIFCDDVEMISLEYVHLLATLIIIIIMITCREFILNLHILKMNLLYLYSLFIYNRRHKMLLLYLLAQGTFQCSLAPLLSFSSKDSLCIKT